jgi:hypothetical protein
MGMRLAWRFAFATVAVVTIANACAGSRLGPDGRPAGTPPSVFEFGVIGDAPYILEEEAKVWSGR